MPKKLSYWSLGLLLLSGLVVLQSQAAPAVQFQDWRYVPSSGYAAYLDPDVRAGKHGQHSLRIESQVSEHKGFSSMTRSFKPEPEVRKMRLSADIRCQDLVGWAGIWMRVDGPNQTVLSFDNTQHTQSISGTHDWKRVAVVLEVPPEAVSISMGALISGTGIFWVDNLSFGAVSADTPVSPLPWKHEMPQNLNFED